MEAKITRRFEGLPAAVVCPGPSLTVERYRIIAEAGIPILAVNDAYRLFPAGLPSIVYAADADWWRKYGEEHVWTDGDTWPGAAYGPWENWTQDYPADEIGPLAAKLDLHVIPSRGGTPQARLPGLSFDPAYVHRGWNSGFQALNILVLEGANPILLLGVDGGQAQDGRSHWFGEHPPDLNRHSPYALFRLAFNEAAPQLTAAGIKVWNVSPESSLQCFPKAEVAELFAHGLLRAA